MDDPERKTCRTPRVVEEVPCSTRLAPARGSGYYYDQTMPHLITVVELHRTKSVRLASPALAPGKENDDCRKGRFRLLPVKFTIASQHGVIPGLVFPQVVHTRTEKELWVFWALCWMTWECKPF